MLEFQRQQLRDLCSVVPIPFNMAPHHRFYSASPEIRPREATLIQQYLPYIAGERIPIPNPIVAEFVPTEKQALKMKGLEYVIDAGQPLRHSVVVRVFGFEAELHDASPQGCSPAAGAA